MIHSAWLKGVKAADRDKRTQEVKAYSKAFADLTEVLKTNFKKKSSLTVVARFFKRFLFFSRLYPPVPFLLLKMAWARWLDGSNEAMV